MEANSKSVNLNIVVSLYVTEKGIRIASWTHQLVDRETKAQLGVHGIYTVGVWNDGLKRHIHIP